MIRWLSLATVALAIVAPSAPARAQNPTATADSVTEVRGNSVKYAPVEVPGFASGLQIGVLSGDPAKSGPYTLRLKFPGGYSFPAHYHPMTENLTVISGRFHLGMGDRVNPSALKAYAPGDYLSIPARHPHFGRVDGETVIQLHGTGPFEIILSQPATGGGAPE